MRSRSASVLAGLGAVTLIGMVGVHPVLADETTPTPTTTVTDTPADPPPVTEEPSDPPPVTEEPSDPPPVTEEPTDPPPVTEEPSDPPVTEEPSDPPVTEEPTDPPTGEPTEPPPTGDPTDPPAEPGKPKTPVLSLGLTVSDARMRPGGSITATVRVASANATASGVVLRMSATGATVNPRTQSLGSVGSGGAGAIATVKSPSGAKPGVITLTAAVSASKARSVSRSYKLIITSASGALPPGLSPTSLPPGVPPLTPSGWNPLAGMKGPQVALPPIVPASSPQIAPDIGPLVQVSNLRTLPDEPFTLEELTALQAGFLAAQAAGVTLLLIRLRLVRRTGARVPRAARRRLAGKRPTAARLRTLPPQPALARPRRPLQPVPPIRLSVRPVGPVRQVRPARS